MEESHEAILDGDVNEVDPEVREAVYTFVMGDEFHGCKLDKRKADSKIQIRVRLQEEVQRNF